MSPPKRFFDVSLGFTGLIEDNSTGLARGFKLSTDPFFVEKVRDLVGPYLKPPDHALVLCADEKSQVQALERTQPGLPLGLGYVRGITHD